MEREKRLFQKSLSVRKFSIVNQSRENGLITPPILLSVFKIINQNKGFSIFSNLKISILRKVKNKLPMAPTKWPQTRVRNPQSSPGGSQQPETGSCSDSCHLSPPLPSPSNIFTSLGTMVPTHGCGYAVSQAIGSISLGPPSHVACLPVPGRFWKSPPTPAKSYL